MTDIIEPWNKIVRTIVVSAFDVSLSRGTPCQNTGGGGGGQVIK